MSFFIHENSGKLEAMMLNYGNFWGLYQRLKEGSSALVLTCCEVGLKPEKLFTPNCTVLQNLGGNAHLLEAAQISLAVHRARQGQQPLDVISLTHEGCAFLTGDPLEHSRTQLLWLSRHPMLSASSFHSCHLDKKGHLWVADHEQGSWVSPLALAGSPKGDLSLFS